MLTFSLDKQQQLDLDKWCKEQDARAVAAQKLQIKNPPAHVKECWDAGYPYGGAAGGSLTYSFTPTSLGVSVKVHNAHTGESIDLSDYENW